MAYNQQQQPQQQQFVLTGQMVNIDGQQVLQQPQYVTVSQPAMAAANIGKNPIQRQLLSYNLRSQIICQMLRYYCFLNLRNI